MAKKITMQQIATKLGVSKYVVSKALSGKSGVSAATRERVLETAAQLGYSVNRTGFAEAHPDTASGLALADGKRTIVVLMPNIRFQTKKNLYWGRVLEGISQEIAALQLQMVIVTEQGERVLELFHRHGLLGAIIVGKTPSSVLLDLNRAGLPFVLIDHDDPLVQTDSLFVNNYDSIARIVSHLISLGHRELRFIGPPEYSRSFLERWIGFRMTLEEHRMEPVRGENLPYLTDRSDNIARMGEWLQTVLAEPRPPTALVCANDDLALAALVALTRLGIRVPEEMSVTGFDNIEDAYHSTPPLTTINVAKEALGKRAVETLLARIQKPVQPYGKFLMAGEMILRDSAGPLPWKETDR